MFTEPKIKGSRRTVRLTLGATERRLDELQALTAAAQIERWRRRGLLFMGDQDFQLALELGSRDPDQLRHLAKSIRGVIDEKELEPGDEIVTTVRFEYDDEPEKSPNADATRPPRGQLELIAAFN